VDLEYCIREKMYPLWGNPLWDKLTAFYQKVEFVIGNEEPW